MKHLIVEVLPTLPRFGENGLHGQELRVRSRVLPALHELFKEAVGWEKDENSAGNFLAVVDDGSGDGILEVEGRLVSVAAVQVDAIRTRHRSYPHLRLGVNDVRGLEADGKRGAKFRREKRQRREGSAVVKMDVVHKVWIYNGWVTNRSQRMDSQRVDSTQRMDYSQRMDISQRIDFTTDGFSTTDGHFTTDRFQNGSIQ